MRLEVFKKNNDWVSKTFQKRRGIRQGCPLSAILFILVVEAMAAIHGITVKFRNTYTSKVF